MRKTEEIESFLKKVKIVDSSKLHEKNRLLVLLAEKGEYPCKHCENDSALCGSRSCIPWFVWFRDKWQRIQKAAKNKK